MFDWLKNILNVVDREIYDNTVKEFNRRIAEQEKHIELCEAANIQLRMKVAICELKGIIPSPPDWLDTNSFSYVVRVALPRKNREPEVVKIDIQGLLVETPLIRRIVKNSKWADLPKEKKLDAIWGWVCKNIKYTTEDYDYWQSPDLTIMRQLGDCDDMTNVFVALARSAGVPANEVFGHTGEIPAAKGPAIGHAFPSVLNPSPTRQGWYVYEVTMGRKMDAPTKLIGSNYRVFCAFNDVFNGNAKTEQF